MVPAKRNAVLSPKFSQQTHHMGRQYGRYFKVVYIVDKSQVLLQWKRLSSKPNTLSSAITDLIKSFYETTESSFIALLTEGLPGLNKSAVHGRWSAINSPWGRS